jgi:hypothetical protein
MLQYNIIVVTFNYITLCGKVLYKQISDQLAKKFRALFLELSHFETDLPLAPILCKINQFRS